MAGRHARRMQPGEHLGPTNLTPSDGAPRGRDRSAAAIPGDRPFRVPVRKRLILCPLLLPRGAVLIRAGMRERPDHPAQVCKFRVSIRAPMRPGWPRPASGFGGFQFAPCEGATGQDRQPRRVLDVSIRAPVRGRRLQCKPLCSNRLVTTLRERAPRGALRRRKVAVYSHILLSKKRLRSPRNSRGPEARSALAVAIYTINGASGSVDRSEPRCSTRPCQCDPRL